MAKWGKCDFKQLQKLRDNLAELQETGMDKFCREMSKELAARLLALVIPRTPVGRYKDPVDFTTKDGKHVHFIPHTGKNGGSLRRAWTVAPQIEKVGNEYRINVINTMEYASYVEFGHCTPDRKGWVDGQYFLTISEQKIREHRREWIENRLEQELKKVFNV